MSLDRTREFLAIVDAALAAGRGGGAGGGAGANPHPSLRAPAPLSVAAAAAAASSAAPAYDGRSAFIRATREVSSDLNRTSLKLSALTKLVKKRGMFDDTSAEVERLTMSIKEDMQSTSARLDGLQEYIVSRRANALSHGARPGKPLTPPEPGPRPAAPGAAAAGAAAGASSGGGVDLLNSVQGISHSEVIVGQLKGQLIGFTQSLKGILLARSESMRAQADRRQQFGGVRDLGRPLTFGGGGGTAGGSQPPQPGAAAAPAAAAAGPRQQQQHPAFGVAGGRAGGGGGAQAPAFAPAAGRQAPPPHDGGGDAVISFGASHSPSAAAFQQLSQAQLVPESAMLEARAQDVQAIERHINDLSQLFSRLAVVVAEQASLVERIEDNTSDALSNMEAGQAQLARYWERVSSNRGLVMRVAGTLVVTAVMFALFGT